GPGIYSTIRDFLCDPDAACDALLESKRTELQVAVASEAWALDRYRKWLGYGAWATITTRDLRTPWPEFSTVSTARSLYFLEAWLRADAGDAKAVREALDTDLEFWRLVLRESDTFLDKALAQGFIRAGFLRGNLILRHLPSAMRAEAIPDSWR